MIHLAFRASNVDYLNLMQRCPKLRLIQVPPSYKKTMSNAIDTFLDMQGIELLEGDVGGHRKDLDEYFTVEDATLNEIRSLAASGANMDDMAAQIQKTARIGLNLSSTSPRPRQLLEPKAQAVISLSSRFILPQSSISTMRRRVDSGDPRASFFLSLTPTGLPSLIYSPSSCLNLEVLQLMNY